MARSPAPHREAICVSRYIDLLAVLEGSWKRIGQARNQLEFRPLIRGSPCISYVNVLLFGQSLGGGRTESWAKRRPGTRGLSTNVEC